EVTFSAIGIFDDQGMPGINVAADVVFGSLTYKNVADSFYSDISIDIQIIRTDKPVQSAFNRTFQFTLSDNDNSITSSQDVFTFQERFPMPPGEYTVNVIVTDEQSDKTTSRTVNTQIP